LRPSIGSEPALVTVMQFAECLPVELAARVVQERLGDPAAVAAARMTPVRLAVVTSAKLGIGLEACRHLARLAARFGRIDRRIREVTSRLDGLCTRVTFDS
jgi:hypothetical protein